MGIFKHTFLNQHAVELPRAQTYLLIMLVAFAATVTLTRAFLALTGYPQVGNETFHIAHAVWGGLLLFLAALLPIIFANRWVYPLSAGLNGVGVGLFIDEIGKFITQNNDYFFPLAAPIIYAFFLITLLIFLQIRRPRLQNNPRDEMYHVLEELKEILDRNLDSVEREQIEARLNLIREQDQRPDLQQMAVQLSQFMESDALQLIPRQPPLDVLIIDRCRSWEKRWLGAQRIRRILFVAYVALAISGVINLLVVISLLISPDILAVFSSDALQAEQRVLNSASLMWYFARIILDAVIGLLFALALLLFVGRQDQRAIRLVTIGLVLSLTTLNLLTFYFDQFAAVSVAAVQIIILVLSRYYLREYLDTPPLSDI